MGQEIEGSRPRHYSPFDFRRKNSIRQKIDTSFRKLTQRLIGVNDQKG